jgi:hypothetical protein
VDIEGEVDAELDEAGLGENVDEGLEESEVDAEIEICE